MSAEIEVVQLRETQNSGAIRAFLDIKLGGITLLGVKVIQQPGKSPWVAMPTRDWTDASGKKHFTALFKPTRELKRRIEDALLKEWA